MVRNFFFFIEIKLTIPYIGFHKNQSEGCVSTANQKCEHNPEFSYLSAFLPVCFSSFIKTKSIASPFATRSFNSPNVVAQQPINFDLEVELQVKIR